jgi:hypothetical protein
MQVNWFYVTDTCFEKYKTCKTYVESSKKELMTPSEWIDRVETVYCSLGMDDYFIASSWIACPFFDECKVKVSFEDLENLCADKFSMCGYYMKQGYQKKRPIEWWNSLRSILEPDILRSDEE